MSEFRKGGITGHTDGAGRGRVSRVLESFVASGAAEWIPYRFLPRAHHLAKGK